MAKFAVLDVEADFLIAQMYNIEKVPTIKVFAGDKYDPIVYNGNLTVRAFMDEAFEQLTKLVNDRLTST